MRVIQTNKAYLPLIGGVETTIAGLAAGLSRTPGVEVEAHVCNGNRSFVMHRSELQGVPVFYLPRWGTFASLPLSPGYFWHLAGLKGDILHVHEPFPLVDIAMHLFPRIRKNFRRIVVTWHSDIVRQQWALGIYAPFIRNFLAQVDRIFVSSPALIEGSEYLTPYRAKCEVLPLGLDLAWTARSAERASRVEQIRNSYTMPIVLFVGRLVYYKGLEYLIAAMSGVPDAHLVIIGQGPLQDVVDLQIQTSGLSARITVLPHLDAEELHAYYEA
ncbi:MAG: glycosyltransferase [Ignavibacteriae bacterium]|nr:glycosyltransferase [Ignavibacteriota bacterium]